MNQLFLDLCKILLTECDIQSSADGFQICDVFFCFFGQFGQCFKGTFLFVIFFEIALCIFQRSFCGIQWDFYDFIVVVIQSFQYFCTRFQIIAVSMDQFAVYFVFVPILGIG